MLNHGPTREHHNQGQHYAHWPLYRSWLTQWRTALTSLALRKKHGSQSCKDQTTWAYIHFTSLSVPKILIYASSCFMTRTRQDKRGPGLQRRMISRFWQKKGSRSVNGLPSRRRRVTILHVLSTRTIPPTTMHRIPTRRPAGSIGVVQARVGQTFAN